MHVSFLVIEFSQGRRHIEFHVDENKAVRETQSLPWYDLYTFTDYIFFKTHNFQTEFLATEKSF